MRDPNGVITLSRDLLKTHEPTADCPTPKGFPMRRAYLCWNPNARAVGFQLGWGIYPSGQKARNVSHYWIAPKEFER